MKEEYNHYQLLKHLPSDFRQFLEHIQALDYYDKPDYAMLSGLFERCMKRRGVKVSGGRKGVGTGYGSYCGGEIMLMLRYWTRYIE